MRKLPFWLVVSGVAIAAASLVTAGLVLFSGHGDERRFCTTEALITPEGNLGRDPSHDCLFVDSDGKPYTNSDGGVVN